MYYQIRARESRWVQAAILGVNGTESDMDGVLPVITFQREEIREQNIQRLEMKEAFLCCEDGLEIRQSSVPFPDVKTVIKGEQK